MCMGCTNINSVHFILILYTRTVLVDIVNFRYFGLLSVKRTARFVYL